MDLRQLRYFVGICKLRNFTRAAESNFISLQGISMSIQRLEEEIGHKLFERSPHGVTLTEHAEYLLPKANEVLRIVDECEQHFLVGASAGERIPVMFVMGSYEEFGGEVVQRFERQFGEVEIIERHDPECEDAVYRGDAPIAVTVEPVDDKRFDMVHLYTTKNVLVMHREHPLASKQSISVNDLRDIPIVVLNESMRSYKNLLYACRQAGFEPKISAVAESVMLIYYMADTDQAVGLSTQPLAKRMARTNVVAVPFADPILDRDICIIKKKGMTLPEDVNTIYHMLIDAGKAYVDLGV